MAPINNDQLPTFPSYYGGDSPPNPLRFALRSLEYMRCWDFFEDPPQAFGQRVGGWLHSILSIRIFFPACRLLLGYRPVRVFSNCASDVPLGEFILVEHNMNACTFNFLDHPAKRNIGQSMFCITRRISSANICVPSAYHNWEPEFTKTYRNDTQRTIPPSHLSQQQPLVFLHPMYCL